MLTFLVSNSQPATAQSPDEALPTVSPSANLPPVDAVPESPTDNAAKYRIEKGLRMFQGIKDDAIFPWTSIGQRELTDVVNDQMEERSFDEVLRHARQFSTLELEQHARRDVSLKELFTAGRVMHKLELFYFEGRLKRLARAHPSELLKDSGITDVYEAWVFPKNEIEPLCVLVTELPPGLTPQKVANEEYNDWVGIAGYYFKLLRYESKQPSKSVKGENQMKRAPVLMGRSLTLLSEPESASQAWRMAFLPILVAGVLLVGFVLLVLSWYYRRKDAVIRATIENSLSKNPFTLPSE